MKEKKSVIDLSIIIPTFDEELSIKSTLENICSFLSNKNIDYEVIIVDDNSTDNTKKSVIHLMATYNTIHFFLNQNQKGFGNSVLNGISKSNGKYISIMMADGSDSVNDLFSYYKLIESDSNIDCVFGTRWKNNTAKNYPFLKKLLNRIGNKIISYLFTVDYDDFTNSFKLYKKQAIEKVSPILSNHFSITLELPLKMIVRDFNFKILPNSWENREHGVSKLKIINIIVTYSLVIIYCLIDKYFWKKRYVNSK